MQTATYTHAPRPPEVSKGKYSNQRRFGDSRALTMYGASSSACVEVYRDANNSIAEVSIHSWTADHPKFRGHSCIDMTAQQMEELAYALLDAAHDLRTQPTHRLLASASEPELQEAA